MGRGIVMITESKLKSGKLTLGGTGSPPVGGEEFACQATNVRIVPTFNDQGDEVETLCGDKLSPDTTSTWNLQGTSIQDFDNPESFIKYTWDNNLTKIPFTWQPNAAATVISGIVQMRAVEMGGDVNTRITTDFDWPLDGDPDVTWPVAAPPLAADEEPTATEEPVNEYGLEPESEPV
jgi:hypothetical protein